jgi:hypothetical protein
MGSVDHGYLQCRLEGRILLSLFSLGICVDKCEQSFIVLILGRTLLSTTEITVIGAGMEWMISQNRVEYKLAMITYNFKQFST